MPHLQLVSTSAFVADPSIHGVFFLRAFQPSTKPEPVLAETEATTARQKRLEKLQKMQDELAHLAALYRAPSLSTSDEEEIKKLETKYNLQE